MMKTKIIIAATLLLSMVSMSCEKFLDKAPDKRVTDLNPDQITNLLVSAYMEIGPMAIAEASSDNLGFHKEYGGGLDLLEAPYLWENQLYEGVDTPSGLWEYGYRAIATANEALQAIEKLGGGEELNAQKGEAFLCRAYAHFVLANIFCQAYNPNTCMNEMGIPYPRVPEKDLIAKYERKTLSYVYDQIDLDIETGLSLLDNNNYSQPAYHFNKKAAYAFAAQFNLFYGKFPKAIAYADKAIGEDPTSVLRNMTTLLAENSIHNRADMYIKSNNPANLLIMPVYSVWGRTHWGRARYTYDTSIMNEISNSPGPWGDAYSGIIYAPMSVFSSDAMRVSGKMKEYFEITDAVAGIGMPYVVWIPFTTNKTLLIRAEAKAMVRDFPGAVKDLNFWYAAMGNTTGVTLSRINSFYGPSGSGNKNTVCKPLSAPAFPILNGDQSNIVQACVHARRIETVHEGDRWYDIKRFGIKITHETFAGRKTLEDNDLRKAIQLPNDVIIAGLPANPR